MLALGDARGLLLADAQSHAAGVGRCPRAADLGAGMEALAGAERIGEDEVLGGALQDGIGLLRVLGDDEEVCGLQRADQHVADLDGGFAAGEALHIKAADLQEFKQLRMIVGGGDGGFVNLLVASMTSPSRAFSRGQKELRLQDALANLPEDQRELLKLRFIDGLPTKDIAERFEKTDGAIRVLLTRTLSKLQDLLTDSC